MTPLVAIRPGYTVPPTTRPSGYQAVGSNQFQNSCMDIRHILRNEVTTHVESFGRQHPCRPTENQVLDKE